MSNKYEIKTFDELVGTVGTGLDYDKKGSRVVTDAENARFDALVERLRADGIVIDNFIHYTSKEIQAETNPTSGKISMPSGKYFVSENARIHALLHEVGHWLSGISVKENNEYGLRPFNYNEPGIMNTVNPIYAFESIHTHLAGEAWYVIGIMPSSSTKGVTYENHREEFIANSMVEELAKYYGVKFEEAGDANINIALQNTEDNTKKLDALGIKYDIENKLLKITTPVEEIRTIVYNDAHMQGLQSKYENPNKEASYLFKDRNYDFYVDTAVYIPTESYDRLEALKIHQELIRNAGVEYSKLRDLFTQTDVGNKIYKKPYLEDMQKGVDRYNECFSGTKFDLKYLVENTNAIQRGLYLPDFIEKIINKKIPKGTDLSKLSDNLLVKIWNEITAEAQIEIVNSKDTRDVATKPQTVGEMIVEVLGGKVSDQFGNEKISFQPESTVEKPKVWGDGYYV